MDLLKALAALLLVFVVGVLAALIVASASAMTPAQEPEPDRPTLPEHIIQCQVMYVGIPLPMPPDVIVGCREIVNGKVVRMWNFTQYLEYDT